METFSTAELPSNGRAAAWNALYATQMSRCDFTPGDRQTHFAAELRIGRLGPVKLARLQVDRCSVERSKQDIQRSAPRMYNFLIQAKGLSTFVHCGHESELHEGDFVLCDTGIPHFWQTRDASTTIMVRVEPEVLREYLPTPEQFCGRPLGRTIGFTSAVGAMVRSLTEEIDAGKHAGYESRVGRYLLDMISMSYAMGFETQDGSAVQKQRRNDVVRYIEDHLTDPELSPGAVAAGLRVSARYLRTIFSASGERISAYILRRRLEECARQIRDPAWNGRTLTEIAYGWGFNSNAHFTRSFHKQYGVPPRAYRHQA